MWFCRYIRSRIAITLVTAIQFPQIQIVFSRFLSVDHILGSFDIDVCYVGFNGFSTMAMQRLGRSIRPLLNLMQRGITRYVAHAGLRRSAAIHVNMAWRPFEQSGLTCLSITLNGYEQTITSALTHPFSPA